MPTKYSILLAVALSVIFLDQYTKYLASHYLSKPESPCKKERDACEERCRKAKAPLVASVVACQKECSVKEGLCTLAYKGQAIPAWNARLEDLKRSSWCRRVDHLWGNPECIVVSGFFHYRYQTNRGAAWGMFSTYPDSFRRPFFMTITAFALLFIFYLFVFLISSEHKLMVAALSSILGGALGNFLDRVRLDYVVDFIYWYFPYGGGKIYPWPTFNVADAAISVGVSLILVELLFHREEHASEEDETPEPSAPLDERNDEKTHAEPSSTALLTAQDGSFENPETLSASPALPLLPPQTEVKA